MRIVTAVLPLVVLLANGPSFADDLRPPQLSEAEWRGVLTAIPTNLRSRMISAELFPVPPGGCEAALEARVEPEPPTVDSLLELVRFPDGCGLVIKSDTPQNDRASPIHKFHFDFVDGEWRLWFHGRGWTRCFS